MRSTCSLNITRKIYQYLKCRDLNKICLQYHHSIRRPWHILPCYHLYKIGWWTHFITAFWTTTCYSYNMRAVNITIYTKMAVEVGEFCCYIKRKNKWVDEDIDSFQFGSFINSLRRKEPLFCKSQEEENSCRVEKE